MNRKRLLRAVAITLLVLIVAGVIVATVYYQNLPERLSQHETIILGQNRFVPGSNAAIRVVVRDSSNAQPLSNAEVSVKLLDKDSGATQAVFSGRTDDSGLANVSFHVDPSFGFEQTLIVETRSELGSDKVERPVTIDRDYRILLTTDKPLYQPGQIIHTRALALGAFDRIPASEKEIEFVIADGKGNKVFRKTAETSAFGVASLDFQLASEVNTGNYKISAYLDDMSSEKTVTVEHYVLPKFNVELETDRSYYLPGQHAAGTIQSAYFFGKPVAYSDVLIEGYTFDVAREVVFTIEGQTDDVGSFSFDFDLPGYIAGTDFEGGLGRFYLQASVTDQTNHAETSNLSLPVAGSALVVDVVPEAGVLRQGVDNILYLMTSYPDGSPAETEISIEFYETGEVVSAETGEFGLAEIHFTPQSSWQSIAVQARDPFGNYTEQYFDFEGDWVTDNVLLRPDKPVYRVGETMLLSILTANPSGTVYLDIIREGQTVSTRSMLVDEGQTMIAVDLTPDLYGTLELHAYKILASGQVTRDTRLVVVDEAADLGVALKPSKDTYLPGEIALVDVSVTDPQGNGVQSVLGMAIVDESVFALAEQDPGFAKLYFMLEAEILTPKYDLHGFSVPDLVSGYDFPDPILEEAVQGAARASLASSISSYNPFSLEVNSHQDAMQNARQKQSSFFAGLGTALYVLTMIVALFILILALISLKQAAVFWQSVTLALLILLGLFIFILFVPLGQNYDWARSSLDRLGVIMDFLSYRAEGLLAVLFLVGIAAFIALVVTAIRRKDGSLGWSLGLMIFNFVILLMMVMAVSRAGVYPKNIWLMLGIIAYLFLPLAFFLRFAGYVWKGRALAAIAALPLALFLLVAFIPVMANGVAVHNWGGAMVKEEDLMEAVPQGMVLRDAEMPAMAMEMEEMAVDEAMPAPAESGEGASAQEAPRLRQYFPETMLWLPDAETDQNGELDLEFDVADSITTWRMTALASSQDGRLGSVSAPLRVFQDFFIDLDLPLALTVGDEISVPVGIFNYLSESQTVRLELEQAEWFTLMDDPEKEITIASNDISVVYFSIKAEDFGSNKLKVTAWGSKMSDAIQKEVRVYPDGKQIYFTSSDRLEPGKTIHEDFAIPEDAVPGTQNLLVKIYPGIVSQVVEGLDSILRMPYGCFEQTTSTTYPNVLVMDYMNTTGQSSPEVQFKAEEYINLGYQRLLTFEVLGSGGFSLFGDAPADRMLTAYGLQEFSDMARVHPVDRALIDRAAEWLLSQQMSDGAWENDRGLVHEDTWSKLGNDKLPVTAYITWSLLEAGFGEDARTQNGLAYVKEHQSQSEDAYVLALVSNALVAGDIHASQSGSLQLSSPTQSALDRLANMAKRDNGAVFWLSGVATFMGSEGQTGSIETTALAALALLKSEAYPDLANGAMTHLIKQKDSFGTWHSTQATILSLKVLLQSVRSGAENVNADVTVTLNGGQAKQLQVTPENFDVVQLLKFDDINIGRENRVEIKVQGEGSLMYQVSGSYYLPWQMLAAYPELVNEEELVTIDVDYDRTELSVNDTVEVAVDVRLNQPGGKAESALIDLGIPPGFTVESEDLAALVARFDDVPEDYAFPTIERFELTGRQVLVYISNLTAGEVLAFSYRLRAKFPLSAQTPASNVYDYYNPNVSGISTPQQLIVR